ncbi:MAG: DsbA family protein [Solirubrobacterales bacterium]|nr:DsbA family protein [Solirubrobacterales bacterium]
MSASAVQVRVVTDPACAWSWASEPKLRRLSWEFGETLEMRWVMGGMARTIEEPDRRKNAELWLDVAAESEMPFDPRLWSQGGISSTYPACQAVVAACEQGPQAAGRYLRVLREGLMYGRRRLDHAEALIAEAGAAGLDVPRFELDLRSNAILEAFGAHLEEARRVERVSFPSLTFIAGDGSRRGVDGRQPYERYAEAATDCGAEPTGAAQPSPLEVIDRFGRCATREIEELTGRPRVVAEAELWSLAREWRLKPVMALTGTLWERA